MIHKAHYLQRISCTVRMSVIRAVFQEEVLKTYLLCSGVNVYVQAEKKGLY